MYQIKVYRHFKRDIIGMSNIQRGEISEGSVGLYVSLRCEHCHQYEVWSEFFLFFLFSFLFYVCEL